MFEALHTIFRRPTYTLTALAVAWVVFSVAVWLPNMTLIARVVASPNSSFWSKVEFLFSLYGSIGTNFTLLSATYTVLIALLFGINIALFTFYIRKQRSIGGDAQPVLTAGVGGLVSGFLGIGCAACGTFILTTLLSVFGATAILAYLPLGGGEFGILGVALLSYSVYALVQKIKAPNVCT